MSIDVRLPIVRTVQLRAGETMRHTADEYDCVVIVCRASGTVVPILKEPGPPSIDLRHMKCAHPSGVFGYRAKPTGGYESVTVCRTCGDESVRDDQPTWQLDERDECRAAGLECRDCGLWFTTLNPWSGHVLSLHRRKKHL